MRLDAYRSRAWQRRRPTDAKQPRLVADPYASEASARRFAHQDVPTLSASQLWSEQIVVTLELAGRAHHRVRPRLVTAWPAQVTDESWLMERLRLLRRELARRGHHAAA